MALATEKRIAQAILAYHRQADSFRLSTQELLAWYRSLSPEIKAHVAKLGPYHWAILPAFKLYVLESRGYSLRAYLAQTLNKQEFEFWLKQQEDNPQV